MLSEPHNLTQILESWRLGDPTALDRLTPLVYTELHGIAERYFATERPGHVLQPTALVNEAFLRLLEWQPNSWQNRAHFYGVSAQLMRRILVHHARQQKALKRGAGAIRVSLSDADLITPPNQNSVDFESLDQALTELESLSARQSQIVELRYFGGLSLDEAAAHLQISVSTIRRDWLIARAWLSQRLTSK
jgi:RNA polymerase sigma factor (TIGR02999 family)